MITRTEDFFADGCGRCERFASSACSARQWADGLDRLRRICLALGLVETVKWGHPCYMHAGRNIVVLVALRGDFRMNFFNAVRPARRPTTLRAKPSIAKATPTKPNEIAE